VPVVCYPDQVHPGVSSGGVDEDLVDPLDGAAGPGSFASRRLLFMFGSLLSCAWAQHAGSRVGPVCQGVD
jgi:hypothetical protein